MRSDARSLPRKRGFSGPALEALGGVGRLATPPGRIHRFHDLLALELRGTCPARDWM
jgi:hypothetical protein